MTCYQTITLCRPFETRLRMSVVALCVLLGAPIAQSQVTQEVYEGFTEPRYEIMVAATEIGRLDEVLVEVGDIVRQGQTIARLEDSLQASSVRIAKQQTEMRGEIDAALAETMLHTARRDQLQELAADAMARPTELARAEADLKVAEARHVAAIEQQELRRLEYERYQLQLARRRVTAPMAGVVSKIFHQPGEYITPADPAVIRLLVIDQLFGVFNVPAEDVGTFQLESEVRVFLRSTRKTVQGRVHSLAPDIDGESGTVQVKIALENENGKLLVGDRCTLQMNRSRKVATRPSLMRNPHAFSKSR